MLAGKKLDPSADRREGSGKVSEEIAKKAGVSPRAVEQFMYIEKHADKKLVDCSWADSTSMFSFSRECQMALSVGL